MDKREMIERALERFYQEVQIRGWKGWRIDSKTLADQAIVIECEVEHRVAGERHGQLWTKVSHQGRTIWAKTGGHGTPGKAIAIVLSLEEG